MILIISKFPTVANDKDGMMQRIAAIDKILDDCNKIYIEISYTKKFRKTNHSRMSDNTRVYKTNAVMGLFLAMYYAFSADKIYVHSLLNAIKILPLYIMFNKIVTDMHGIVPEELYMEGRTYLSKLFNLVEQLVFIKSSIIITVTEAMSEYLKEKYKTRSNIITVPIFDTYLTTEKVRRINHKPTIIYSGGTQQWQNIDIMLNAIKSTINKYEFIILSGDLDIFESKLLEKGLLGKVVIASVNKNEINKWYSEADLGFILRDNIAVNNVACPTKLVEYLINGVVPIVIHPNIGDFYSMGYCFITLDEFLNNRFTVSDIDRKRQQNYKVIKMYQNSVMGSINEMKAAILDYS